MADALMATQLALPGLRRGKVRDVYDLDADRLLIVATDRISAFDVVMPTPIVGKGELLTRLSTFWLRMVERLGICRTHLLTTDVGDVGGAAGVVGGGGVPSSAFVAGGTTRAQLAGRSTIARRARVVPIECVVRGYLEGSGWREYRETGGVCGVRLPAGLVQCDRLPEPIFTPATKEESGAHDQNISFERASAAVGAATMERLRALSLAIYRAAAEHARTRGIIIADTKFEFGVVDDEIILVDEALTPDSSRFWPVDGYAPGRAQASFDKQYLREYLETLVEQRGRGGPGWNKQAPGPALPAEVVEATRAKYAEACERLIGA